MGLELLADVRQIVLDVSELWTRPIIVDVQSVSHRRLGYVTNARRDIDSL